MLESKARDDDKISWMQKHMYVFVTIIFVVYWTFEKYQGILFMVKLLWEKNWCIFCIWSFLLDLQRFYTTAKLFPKFSIKINI